MTMTTTVEKCFALTGAFEGKGYSTLAGNGDGQGLSWGFIQWCFGQGTLQALLLAMHANGPATFRRCCTQPVAQMAGKVVDLSADLIAICSQPNGRAVAWAAARQDSKHVPLKHWRDAFDALAAEPGFQAIQRAHAGAYMDRAKKYQSRYSFQSERALALLFDICVQQGSILADTHDLYMATAHQSGPYESDRLEALARAAGRQADARWIQDVTARKMTIARGRGTVHGTVYDIARDFGITMDPVTA